MNVTVCESDCAMTNIGQWLIWSALVFMCTNWLKTESDV